VRRKSVRRSSINFDLNGKQMRAVADANNRAMIEATLTGIWNEKFGGAMDKLSGTWQGMLSNLMDRWAQFKLMIMESAAFDALKGKLADLLATIDAMAGSGEIQALAVRIGTIAQFVERLPEHIETTKAAFNDLKASFTPIIKAAGFLFETFGPGKVILGGMALAITAFLLPAVAALVLAVKALAIAIGVTPLGWIIAGLTALAAGAVVVYKNWDDIPLHSMCGGRSSRPSLAAWWTF
jgi:phage tail tape-measure protein